MSICQDIASRSIPVRIPAIQEERVPRGQSIQASSRKQLLQNVISGIFSISTNIFYRMEIANFLRTFSHVGIFDPALWPVLPPPFPCVKVQYKQTVCGWEGMGGWGVELCWRPYSAGVLHSVSDQVQNLQNCSATPKQKLRRGEGVRHIDTRRKVPFQVTFLWRHFALLSIRLIFLWFPPGNKHCLTRWEDFLYW